jgi:hypothetical protein
MKRVLVIWLLTGLIAGVSKAQILHRPLTAAYTGTGVYSLHHTDIFSFDFNQAALARLPAFSAGVYAERRFLLNELNNYRAVAAMPTSSGNFGIITGYSGFNDFNETRMGLAYGKKLSAKSDIGIQFNYYHINASGYGNSSAISFEIGMIHHLSEKVHTGIHINNPVGGKFGNEQQEKLPAVYTFGLGYEASEKFFFSMEIIKEEDQPVNVNAGFQYRLLSPAMIRAGVSTATSSVWFGAGLTKGTMRIDVITVYHPQLGITPGLLVLFNFKNKKK